MRNTRVSACGLGRAGDSHMSKREQARDRGAWAGGEKKKLTWNRQKKKKIINSALGQILFCFVGLSLDGVTAHTCFGLEFSTATVVK